MHTDYSPYRSLGDNWPPDLCVICHRICEPHDIRVSLTLGHQYGTLVGKLHGGPCGVIYQALPKEMTR
jgi:hypothetical protein